jgi:hypothetical protein
MVRPRSPPPEQCAGCLGRRKGAARRFAMGLRPTLPPTCASRDSAGCGQAGRSAGCYPASEGSPQTPLEPVVHRRGTPIASSSGGCGQPTRVHSHDDEVLRRHRGGHCRRHGIRLALGPLRERTDPALFCLRDAGAGPGRHAVEPARPERTSDARAISSSRDGTTRGPWMTPTRARQLAAAAADLYRQLREADLARDADPHPAQRCAGWRLDVAAGGLHRAAEEFLATADELIRLAARRVDAYPVPWAPAPSTARHCGAREGAAGAPPPVAYAGGITTDSPSRAPNRSPIVSSTPRAISSTSARAAEVDAGGHGGVYVGGDGRRRRGRTVGVLHQRGHGLATDMQGHPSQILLFSSHESATGSSAPVAGDPSRLLASPQIVRSWSGNGKHRHRAPMT